MTTKMTTNPIAFEQILNDNRNTWFKNTTMIADLFEYTMMMEDGSVCYATNDNFSCHYRNYEMAISAFLEMCEEEETDPESNEIEVVVVDEIEALEYYKK